VNSYQKLSLEELEQLILPTFFAPIELKIKQQISLLEEAKKLYQSYYDRLERIDSANETSKLINETNWLKESLYDLLEKDFPNLNGNTIEETFNEFFRSLNTHFDTLPEVISKEQKPERFIAQYNDSNALKIKKKFKNAVFYGSKLPFHFINLFRKEKKPLKRWKHKVPVHSISKHLFLNQFLLQSVSYHNSLLQISCEALNVKWLIEKEINLAFNAFLESDQKEVKTLVSDVKKIAEKDRINQLIETLTDQLDQWKTEAKGTVLELYKKHTAYIEKVNTIELSSKEFSSTKLANERDLYKRKFQQINNGWRNTLFAQIDDFQVDIELHQIKYVSLLQFSLLQKSYQSRLNKVIEKHLSLIELELDLVLHSIQKNQNNKNFINELQRDRQNLIIKLERQIIPQTVEAIYNQNFSNLLERLEVRIEEQIDQMKDKRLIYSEDVYDRPINKSELSHFNPKRLIEIDMFNEFSQKLKGIKTSIIKLLEKTELSLVDLVGILDYNLDAAINSVEEEGNEASIHQLTMEGVDRTKSKTNAVKEQLLGLESLLNIKLKKVVEEFNISLIKLTENENITNLRVQLAKAETLKKTKDYRKAIKKKILNILPLALRFLRLKYRKIEALSQKFGKKVGLLELEKELTPELSDFLLQTELATAKLPYVYRRLYRIRPTEEEVFFEARNKELNLLSNYYQNWKNNNFSATAIIGEKGSGASSLVNFFLKEIDQSTVIRKKLTNNKFTEVHFFNFFNELLGKENLNSVESIAEELNSGNYSLIILEDLQHFYIKKIQGFTALNMLFELISKTEKKVYWLVEFTVYAWKYLEKSVSINKYFKYSILLQQMSEEQIVKIIMKRHRVSGYDFQIDSSNLSTSEKRKIKKLEEEEKDAYLKEIYFKALNRFAENNISLALLYWIRSTKKVENNVITIGILKNLNFNLINTLPDESVFTLHALLLHDSLTVEDHAQIFNNDLLQSRLSLMVLVDKGILVQDENRYQINRLLYRQVVNVLSNKNILH
tara:strand:+ start:7093 stop:10116 length:3024 start_codon:yes stop_codon:yes gene_type:complete